jgi:hypothetical protein
MGSVVEATKPSRVLAPAHAVPAMGRRVVVPAAAAAVYLAFAFAMFASAWRNPFLYSIGNPGDQSLYMWQLTWPQYALLHSLNPFFSDYANYPAGVNLLWDAAMPIAAILLWPVTSTLGPLLSYNLLVTVGVALSAWTAFLLIRRYVRQPVAAGVGGLLYGFSPYMAAHAHGHVAIIVVFLTPLILLVIDEIVRVQRHRPLLLGVALALLSFAQFFTSEEVLLTTGMVVLVLVVVAAALWPQHAVRRVRYAATALLSAGALFALLVAWPVAFQLFGPQHFTVSPHGPNVYVNDLLGFWVPTEVQWIAPRRLLAISAKFTGNAAEWNSYVGVPLSLLLVFSVVRHWHNDWVRLSALAGAIVAILSLGITLHVGGSVKTWLPVFTLALGFLLVPSIPARALVLLTFALWLALWRMPLVENVLPARLMLYGYLFAGLVMAVFVEDLFGRGWRRLALVLTALLVALVPLVPRLPFTYTEVPVPSFFAPDGPVTRIPEGSVALVAPIATFDSANAMLWQANSNMRFRMPESDFLVPAPGNGLYFDTPPTATTQALRDVAHGVAPAAADDRLRQAMRADLARWGVQTVIVGPMPDQDRAVALLTSAIGRPPERVQGVYVWWDVQDGT